MDGKFLTWMMEESVGGSTLWDLVLVKKEELVEDVKGGGNLFYSDHEMVNLKIMRGGKQAKSRMMTLDFRKVDLVQFRDLLERTHATLSWRAVLRAVCFSRSTSSKLSGQSQNAGSQVIAAGGLHG